MDINWHAWLDTFLEAAILYILIIEYIYDKEYMERTKQPKIRTARNLAGRDGVNVGGTEKTGL